MAAIPKDLLESELFGHEKGAFTGAQVMRRGRFEQAEGGTLFLDEIGDMPLDMQTRLLRVLSDGHFYRVGGNQSVRANVRVVAATHQNLERLVREGSFREDLFHRLNVIRLRLPSLRERAEDIAVLAKHFLKLSAKQLDVPSKRLSKEATAFLEKCYFSGNVRQLENVCYWLTVMIPGQTIEAKDLPVELLESDETANDYVEAAKHLSGRSESDTHVPVPVKTADDSVPASWEKRLEETVRKMLADGKGELMDELGSSFEKILIKTALVLYPGTQKRGGSFIGYRPAIRLTRKIAELGT